VETEASRRVAIHEGQVLRGAALGALGHGGFEGLLDVDDDHRAVEHTRHRRHLGSDEATALLAVERVGGAAAGVAFEDVTDLRRTLVVERSCRREVDLGEDVTLGAIAAGKLGAGPIALGALLDHDTACRSRTLLQQDVDADPGTVVRALALAEGVRP
jgi:hypothetical protein